MKEIGKYMLTAIFAVLMMAVGLAGHASAQSKPVREDLAKYLNRYESVKLNASEARKNKALFLPLDGRKVRIVLEENDLRSDNLKKTEPRKTINTFKGIVDGEANSTVRLNFRANGVEAIVLLNGETFYVQSLARKVSGASTDDAVVFKPGDVTEKGKSFCGIVSRTNALIDNIHRQSEHSMSFVKANYSPAPVPTVSATPFPQPKQIDIYVASDKEMLLAVGSDVFAVQQEVHNQLNIAEAIYTNTFNLVFQITTENYHRKTHTEDVWTFEADPIDQSLFIFNEWMFYNAPNGGGVAPWDLALLFTGLFPGGASPTTAGLAYPQSVCTSGATAIVGRTEGYVPDGLFAAHEMGHIVGQEDHVFDGTIMNYLLGYSNTMTFNQVSQDNIINHITTYGLCIKRARLF